MGSELLVMFIVVGNAVVLALGGVITHLAYRAYRRTNQSELWTFAVGFGLITLGLLGGGGLHQLIGAEILVGDTAQVSLSVIGFGFLAYSLYSS